VAEDRMPESNWPNEYEAPTLEPLGAVWELTEGFNFFSPDLSTFAPQPGPSDVAIKENFGTVATDEILDRLRELPLQTWNYKADDEEMRHIGPTAQDFNAAFDVGEDRRINPIDAAGVSFAAIQSLAEAVDQHEAELRGVRAELEELRRSR
jgi:Chaperone of endosialidase